MCPKMVEYTSKRREKKSKMTLGEGPKSFQRIDRDQHHHVSELFEKVG